MSKDKYALSCDGIQGLFDEAFGISVSRGGAAQAVLRVSEQAVRPAVVNPKIFGGNRAGSGGHAQDLPASVFATWSQRVLGTLSFLSKTIRSPADPSHRLIHQLLPLPSG